MKAKKGSKWLVCKEERELVFNSEIIGSYPELKVALKKYERISAKNLKEDKIFDEELRNQILFVFKSIKKEAETEWYGNGDMQIIDPPNSKDRIQCSLCGTRNKYIFYIANRFNDKKLNVGSDCIGKFPGIDNRLPEGMTLKQLKSKKIRDYEKLKRLEEFNKSFPNAKEFISNWIIEYGELPIILPNELHNKFDAVHKEAKKIFDDYIEGIINNNILKRFEKLIGEREELMIEANQFINDNRSHKFICTREIYNWILKEYKNDAVKLVNRIRDSSSILTKDIIPLIYEDNFFMSMLDDFKEMLSKTRISLTKVEDSNVYFLFEDARRRFKCELFISQKGLMELYGDKLEEKYLIDEKEFIEKVSIVNDLKNYEVLVEEVEKVLKGTGYKMKIDYEATQTSLKITHKKKDIFADGLIAKIFFNNHKTVIILNDEYARDKVCRSIDSVKKWKKLSEEKKFKIDRIDKRPDRAGFQEIS